MLETPPGRAGSRNPRKSGVWLQPGDEGVIRAALGGVPRGKQPLLSSSPGLSAHKLESSGILKKTWVMRASLIFAEKATVGLKELIRISEALL